MTYSHILLTSVADLNVAISLILNIICRFFFVVQEADLTSVLFVVQFIAHFNPCIFSSLNLRLIHILVITWTM